MKSKLLKTVLLTIVLAAVLTVSALAASIGGGTVTATALNLRCEPSMDSPVKDVVPVGSALIIENRVNDDWYAVIYKGIRGYVAAEYINFTKTLDFNFGMGTIKGDDVRMRTAAGFDGSVIRYNSNGTKMTVIGVSGPWYKVQFNGIVGYVHSDYMTLGKCADSSTTGQTIVETAQKYLGAPYVWAGSSPNGFDCSGFVQYVYKKCGYSINRTAASIYDNGTYADKADLRPGDVVCFSTSSYSGIGHVGIYIGDGQFIHASSSSGKVIITDLNTPYYVNHYVGARRIV
ncbi:MAG TPA: C40 family peptidase [Clostridiales bacterium]|nr:C40 family peptidase [Clostridiales bacterium]